MTVLDFVGPFKDEPTSSLVAAVVKRPRNRVIVSDVQNFSRCDTAQLIDDLERHSTRSFEDRVKSALIVRELRARVEAGDMGNISWYSWALKNIKLGKTRLKEHMRVAKAPNPAAEIERLMKLADARAQRHEENMAQLAKIEWERASVINFAKTRPIVQVQILQQLVAKMPKLT